MIKVKIKREKSTINAITRRGKKAAKVENFTKPLKVVTDDLRKFLKEGISKTLSGNGKKKNHVATGRLLGTVGTKVVSKKKFATDVEYTIHVGYLTTLARAILLERGQDSQNLTIDQVIDWMRTKSNFRSMFSESNRNKRYAIAHAIRERLNAKGSKPYPAVEIAWEANRVNLAKKIVENFVEIWT